MKPKKFAKRFALRKNTIANLNSGQMGGVIGGTVKTEPPCPIPITIGLPCTDTCITGGKRVACCIPITENSCIETCNTCANTQCSGACC